MDSRSATRARTGFTHTPHWTTWDHRVIGQTIDLNDDDWNLEARQRRRSPKPIGWTLQERYSGDFERDALNIMPKWRHDWDLTHLTAEMQGLTKYGTPRRIGHLTARRSATQDMINAQIREATNMDERRRAQRMLWTKRKQILEEKDHMQMNYVLKNLAGGGWGKKSMTKRLQGMTEYKVDESGAVTTDTRRIAEEATKYYHEVFTPGVDPDDVDREETLQRMLNKTCSAVSIPTPTSPRTTLRQRCGLAHRREHAPRMEWCRRSVRRPPALAQSFR